MSEIEEAQALAEKLVARLATLQAKAEEDIVRQGRAALQLETWANDLSDAVAALESLEPEEGNATLWYYEQPMAVLLRVVDEMFRD